MSVRAIAIRRGPRPVLRGARVPAAAVRFGTARFGTARFGAARAPIRVRRLRRGAFWAALRAGLDDDRRLIGVKLILIGLVGAAMMVVEVTW